MLVTLIRHGQIPANIDKRYVGCRTDEDLTDEGKRQAAEIVPPAATRVFVSPLARCWQTADIIFPDIDKKEVYDLREMDFGIFECRTDDEMAGFEPYISWVDSMCTDPIPDGESMAEFDERCCTAFEGIVRSCSDDDHIVLVVHGGTIMSIMGRYNDEGREYFEYHLNNCEYYTCECRTGEDGGISLHRIAGRIPSGILPPKE